MGLFNKKKENRSPSGHFTDDVTPSGEKDEQSAMRPTEETHREASSSSRKDLTGGEHEHAHESDAASTSKPNLRDAEVAGAAAEEHKETVGEDGAVKETTAVESTSVEPAKTETGETVPVQETTRVEATTIEGVSPAAAGENKVKEVAMAPHGHHRQPASDAALSPEDAAVAEHDHKYLKPVVHERRHIHEVEEFERQRTIDRHVHHVQTHVQPLVDERHLEEVHSFREVPVSHVEERHANSPEEAALLARLNAQSISTYTVVPHDRVKVDRGETQVTENVIHHYHTIVQPVWQRDLHEFYRMNSTFTPQTMISPDGKPLSPSAVSGSSPSHFSPAAHPPNAQVSPSGGPSMTGIPAAREGHKLVPDSRPEVGGESTRYEVEFVNREPFYAQGHREHMTAGQTGMMGGANVQRGASTRTGASTMPPQSESRNSGLESGVRDMNLGVAK